MLLRHYYDSKGLRGIIDISDKAMPGPAHYAKQDDFRVYWDTLVFKGNMRVLG